MKNSHIIVPTDNCTVKNNEKAGGQACAVLAKGRIIIK